MPDLSIAPTVEMLWEVCDPNRALLERFGFDDGTAAGRWVASVLAGLWGVEVLGCERIVISGSNALASVTTPAGGRLAKWSVAPERFHRLDELARLTGWLGESGLPVSAPVPAFDGRLQVRVTGYLSACNA